MDRGSDHVGLRTHVDEAADRGDGAHGVQGREHEVTCYRGAQADVRRLLIAHLADEDDVRIVSQYAAQDLREVQPDLRVDLHLVDAVQAILDRILHRDDLGVRVVQVTERGIQGRGLAAACRPGDQYHAGVVLDEAAEARQRFRRHAELIQRHQAVGLVEEPQHDGFAELRRQRGQPHVDRFVLHLHGESAVLRQALLRDVQPAHELQARDQGRRDAPAVHGLLMQDPVHALTDAQGGLAGLDVHVRGAHLHRFLEYGLNETDDRGIRGAFLRGQVLDVDVAFAQVVAHLLRDRGDLVLAAIERIDGLEHVRLAHQREAQGLLQPGGELVARQ